MSWFKKYVRKIGEERTTGITPLQRAIELVVLDADDTTWEVEGPAGQRLIASSCHGPFKPIRDGDRRGIEGNYGYGWAEGPGIDEPTEEEDIYEEDEPLWHEEQIAEALNEEEEWERAIRSRLSREKEEEEWEWWKISQPERLRGGRLVRGSRKEKSQKEFEQMLMRAYQHAERTGDWTRVREIEDQILEMGEVFPSPPEPEPPEPPPVVQKWFERYGKCKYWVKPGVDEAIDELSRRGIPLGMASANDPVPVVEALKALGIYENFARVEAGWDPKGVMVERVMEDVGVSDPCKVMFVDDNAMYRADVFHHWKEKNCPLVLDALAMDKMTRIFEWIE